MVTALLIDDDNKLRDAMKGLLALYAPQITLVGEADSVESAVKAIVRHKPNIIFLDIQLTDGTGFDILEQINEMFGKIESHVVFITAHEQFAIKAFRFSALDYLLKPVDPVDLEKVISKIDKTLAKTNEFAHVELLLENIKKQTNSFKRIALSNSDGIHLFDVADIIRCESHDNYTSFHIRNSKPVLISRTLKEYEEMLKGHGFIRIHQSHLINMAFLKSFIKKEGGYVIMADDSHLPISQRKKDQLNDIISKQLNS